MTHPAAGTPATAGAAFLAIDLVAGASTVTSARSHQPAKLLVPVPRGPSVWACTSSFGGGFVGGDHTRLDIRLGPHSRAYVGSQASSKIYKSTPTRPSSSHTTSASLAQDSVLVLAPDPVQPFAGASFLQHQRFSLHPSASLVLLDTLHSGRTARGERWAFNRFLSRNEILVGPDPILLDTLDLDSAHGPIAAPHRTGRFNAIALLILVGPAASPHARVILDSIAARPVPRHADLLLSASPLHDGAIIRIAAVRGEQLTRELHSLLSFLPLLLHHNPWERKG